MKWCMKETDSTEEIARVDLSDIACINHVAAYSDNGGIIVRVS